MTRNLTLHYDRMMLLLDPNISGPVAWRARRWKW
jgi:hypothetical protein